MMKYSGIVMASTASLVVLHGCGDGKEDTDALQVKVYEKHIPLMKTAAEKAAEEMKKQNGNKETAKKFCDDANAAMEADLKLAKDGKPMKESSFIQGKDEEKETPLQKKAKEFKTQKETCEANAAGNAAAGLQQNGAGQ